ncbi:MAG: DUF1552 domain-containing protein [Polyangiaceae bacterium]
MKRTQLSRRTVLRGLLAGGLATTVGLPTLEAMLNSNGTAFADGSPLPVRLIVWCFGNGVVLNRWVPGGIRTPVTGKNFPLGECLQPFANVKDYLTVCSGFDNKCKYKITHHEGMTIFSGHSMTDIGQGSGFFSNARGPSMDQRAAAMIGNRTTIPSLQLGCITQISQADYGTTMHNVSHKDHLQPLPPEKNPQAAYNQIAGLFVPPDDPSKPSRLSVVDSVRADLNELKKRLGQADIKRMDAHIEAMNQLETKIKAVAPLCGLPGLPEETNDQANGIRAVNEAMADLTAFAFSCDVTRIVSYLFVGGASEAGFPEIGTPSQHGLSHGHWTNALAAGAPPYEESGQVDNMAKGVAYEMEMAAYFAEKLAATEDAAGGNLLDNTVMFVSSDCSEGFAHSLIEFPMLVIGKAGGRLNSGVHYRSPNKGNASDVLLSVLQAVVPEATEVGSVDAPYLVEGAPDPAYSNTPFADMKTGL